MRNFVENFENRKRERPRRDGDISDFSGAEPAKRSKVTFMGSSEIDGTAVVQAPTRICFFSSLLAPLYEYRCISTRGNDLVTFVALITRGSRAWRDSIDSVFLNKFRG